MSVWPIGPPAAGERVKGTVRPDWIWMRVVPLENPLKGHQLIYVFNFLFFILNIIFDKSSKFRAASCKNVSNLLLVRITVCIESCLPIGWRTFIWWKNLPKCSSILVCIAEWWLTSRNPKNNWYLYRIFGARFGEKDRGLSSEHMQTVNRTSRRIRGFFAWSGSELWSCFKYPALKLENQKPIAVDVLFKAYPMVPLSCRSNQAGRYLETSDLAAVYNIVKQPCYEA